MATDEEQSEITVSSGWTIAGVGAIGGMIWGLARRLHVGNRDGLLVLGCWISWAAVVGSLYLQYWMSVLHPSGWLLVGLLLIAIVATLLLAAVSIRRMVVGPSRARGALMGLGGLAPLGIVLALVAIGMDQFRRGHIETRLPLVLLGMGASSLGEFAVGWTYPHRIETDQLVMSYGDELEDPQADVALMEGHIRRLHYMTHRGPRSKVHWVRGKVFGQGRMAIAGLALGSDRGPIATIDLHAVGHKALYELHTPDVDPAMVFAEGWAEAVSRDSLRLAREALALRDRLVSLAELSEDELQPVWPSLNDAEGMRQMIRRMKEAGPDHYVFLKELTSPFWYHRDREAVSTFGGAFADFVFRNHTSEQFVSLYLGTHPSTLDLMCERIFQKTPEELEVDFWRDMEQFREEADSP